MCIVQMYFTLEREMKENSGELAEHKYENYICRTLALSCISRLTISILRILSQMLAISEDKKIRMEEI